jgi:hypothetical protein
LIAPLKVVPATSVFPNGWAVGASEIKKHGSRTATQAGITVSGSTFDGAVLAASDTVTAGIWYSGVTTAQSGGGRRYTAYVNDSYKNGYSSAYRGRAYR